MSRQQKETTVLHSSSSIALLQERFRQLQRVKEMREEREFQKVGLGLGTGPGPDPHGGRAMWFCHPDLVRPIGADPTSGSISNAAPIAGGKYLGINSVNFVSEGGGSWGSGRSIGRGCDSSNMQNLKNCSDAHDVDTSLHL
ncbi:SPBc2 prophage-derived uncharacterized protein yotK [Rhynchospora pubera]|uniref:SPBc2 prophage-derived uncharacterized protein yotK n=1 Tax=Rhynchospora pubera TaxID=906938 RepID=A0AAV8C8W3_9POAL|nr:SPBc2 prophage-derived uncharacterized protein yotK [Rhynchospora pubera]KAJ4819582.1 SPBc2 prophage-derived uncharacterized protein yotK [Rhynchospora pubera]